MAGQLPQELGLLLLGAAREAFMQGLHLTVFASVAISAAASVLVFVALRNMQGTKESEKSGFVHEESDR